MFLGSITNLPATEPTAYEKRHHLYHKVLNEREGKEAGSFRKVPRWMHSAGYGIMWHGFVFNKTLPVWDAAAGKFKSPIDGQVSAFPVDKLIESYKKTGGSYFQLALNQGKGTEITHFPEQLKIEQEAKKDSGLQRVASKRDLGLEIGKAILKTGTRFCLYAWPNGSKSEHFKGMVSMWWCDGWWWILQDHKKEKINSYKWMRENIEAADKFNPNALVCVNAGGVCKVKRGTPACTMTPGENRSNSSQAIGNTCSFEEKEKIPDRWATIC